MPVAAVIVEMDTERDRKTCIALDLKVGGANRELAQWLLNHPRYSAPMVAQWIGCNAKRVQRLRKWAQDGFIGTPYDASNSARDRTSTSDGSSNLLDNPKLTDSGNGTRIPVPEGKTVSEVCREAIKDECPRAADTAKRLGWAERSYAWARAIVQLADREDLEDGDKKIVQEALTFMDATRRTRRAFEHVRPIVDKLWGKERRGNGAKGSNRERKRIDAFMRSIGAITGACAACDHVEVPYLSTEEIGSVKAELSEAQQQLNRLISKIGRIRNG